MFLGKGFGITWFYVLIPNLLPQNFPFGQKKGIESIAFSNETVFEHILPISFKPPK